MRNKEIWIKRIQDYKFSSLTAAKWCEENGISYHTLRYHIHKLNKEKKQTLNRETQWASVIPETSDTNNETAKPIKVTIGHSTIEVIPGFDHDTFKSIISILENYAKST